MKSPKVAIIILNWNGLDDTIECLDSLQDIVYPNYEVIIVDNGSQGDDVIAIEQGYGSYVQIIENQINLGFAGGNNVGIKYALRNDNEYILLLNNDTVVEPHFLNELIEVATKDELIGIVGPKLYYYNDRSLLQLPEWYGKVGNVPKEMSFISGAAMLIRRTVLEKVGLLDEEFYPGYGEDWDFCQRVGESGFKLICVPSSAVYHKSGASTEGNFNLRVYTLVKYPFLIVRRHRIEGSYEKSTKFLIMSIYMELRKVLWAIKEGRSFSPLIAFLHGIIDGVIIFLRNPKEKW